jgi:phthiocerol/phenolphthiocerol synthesis type-I polyketide synthase E
MSGDHGEAPIEQGVAVIGMSGRFPGADSVDDFWRLLVAGRELLRRYTAEELAAAGVTGAGDPAYVPVAGALDEPGMFDAEFFGMTPAEAELTDPQQRLFLECAWAALESAGYPPQRGTGRVGVFASAASTRYRAERIDHAADQHHPLQVAVGNDVDMLALRVSYKLDLRGPSVTVQTACSSSLVAVHQACQSLLVRESDVALAGGAAVRFLEPAGYRYVEGGILSPDGHCRPFDSAAAGTVVGDGVGVVVLKRLEDALADGDHIHAVIRGSAVNNDGAAKAGFTAPSPTGQATVICEALDVAGVDPRTVRYVEAHGTATPLGDPIEVQALVDAFGSAPAPGSCYLGSVKSNLGHLDTAAGIAGLLKAVLAVEHRFIPPTLHFETAGPETRLADSPFQVNTEGVPWPADAHPPRAGVSSFGIGGTNAHVVVEAAPVRDRPVPVEEPTWQVLPLSARTESALDAAADALAAHLADAGPALPAVAATLQFGRTEFDVRRAVVCRDRDDAVRRLAPADGHRTGPGDASRPSSVVFMFPGQGSQYPGMGAELYRREPVFRQAVDACAELLSGELGWDVREVMFDSGPAAAERLRQTLYTQPALFTIEYALAEWVMSVTGRPAGMVGHSIGEVVAACLAGVFTLPDAARFVACRARELNALPSGSMLSVPLAERTLAGLLRPGGPEIAAVNAPHSCVAAGTAEQVAALHAVLVERGHVPRALHTSHAFHTRLVEPALPALRAVLASMTLHPPRLPFASNVTGSMVTQAEACDPEYWVSHARRAVRFADGVSAALALERLLFIEVGPGEALSTLVRVQTDPVDGSRPRVVTTLRRPRDGTVDELRVTREALAALWQEGVPVDWAGQWSQGAPGRVPLPTYPFQRSRYLPGRARPADHSPARRDRTQWTYVPTWYPSPALPADEPGPLGDWLVFLDHRGIAGRLVADLRSTGDRVAVVRAGADFARPADDEYTIRPGDAGDVRALVQALAAAGRRPARVLHAWAVGGEHADRLEVVQDRGVYTVLALAQALADTGAGPVRLDVLTDDLSDAAGATVRRPERATLLGAAKVLGQELAELTVHWVDVTIPPDDDGLARLAGQLVAELRAPAADTPAAYRAGRRWSRAYLPVSLGPVSPGPVSPGPASPPASGQAWRPGAGYLVTGAAGESGAIFAEHLAETGARVAVLADTGAVDTGAVDTGAVDTGMDATLARRLAALAERHPGRVTVLPLDATDESSWRTATQGAIAALGRVDGVVHALDTRGTGLAALKDATQTAAVLAARVHSTLLLDDLLRDEPVTSFLISSGMAGMLGGFGQLDNAAAATFLEAYARARTATGRPTTTIDWSQWEWDDWYERQAAPQLRDHFRRHRHEQGIGAADAVAIAPAALRSGLPEVIVAPVDLALVLAGQDQLTPDGFLDTVASTRATVDGWDPTEVWPDDEVARDVARVWCEVLGLPSLRSEDDFFEVGGNSLFAIQIIARLRRTYGDDLPMSVIFEAATVEGVASAIRAQEAQAIGLDEFEALLRDVEGLSAEEAAARLEVDRA